MKSPFNATGLVLAAMVCLSHQIGFCTKRYIEQRNSTKRQIVTMVKAAFQGPVSHKQIRASKSNFNTNTDELIRLQQAHVRRK